MLVVCDLSGGTATFVIGVAEVATGAGIHGTDEHKTGWISEVLVGTSERDLAILQRLSKGFNDSSRIFGEFVEEENTVVSEGNFARKSLAAASEYGNKAGAMMGRTEGALMRVSGEILAQAV